MKDHASYNMRNSYYNKVKKAISMAVICLFLLNNSAIAECSIDTLAVAGIDESPMVKRGMIASMYRAGRLIWEARSSSRLELLKRYNALALLFPSGIYLMTPEILSNDLALIRAVTHEDNEILMQQEEKNHPERYKRLMRQISARDDIMTLYYGLSHHKDPDSEPDNIVLNDLISKAFEILFIIDEKLIDPAKELTDREKKFIELMRPILEAKDASGRYKNFSKMFFDIDKRSRVVEVLQKDKGVNFYKTTFMAPFAYKVFSRTGIFEEGDQLALTILTQALVDKIGNNNGWKYVDMLVEAVKKREYIADFIINSILSKIEPMRGERRLKTFIWVFGPLSEVKPHLFKKEMFDEMMDLYCTEARTNMYRMRHHEEPMAKIVRAHPGFVEKKHVEAAINRSNDVFEKDAGILFEELIKARPELATKRLYNTCNMRQKPGVVLANPELAVFSEANKLFDKINKIRADEYEFLDMVRLIGAIALVSDRDTSRELIEKLFNKASKGSKECEMITRVLVYMAERDPGVFAEEDITKIFKMGKNLENGHRRGYYKLWIEIVNKRPELIRKSIVDSLLKRASEYPWEYDDERANEMPSLIAALADNKYKYLTKNNTKYIMEYLSEDVSMCTALMDNEVFFKIFAHRPDLADANMVKRVFEGGPHYESPDARSKILILLLNKRPDLKKEIFKGIFGKMGTGFDDRMRKEIGYMKRVSLEKKEWAQIVNDRIKKYLREGKKNHSLHCSIDVMPVIWSKYPEFIDDDMLDLLKSLRDDADRRDLDDVITLFESVCEITPDKITAQMVDKVEKEYKKEVKEGRLQSYLYEAAVSFLIMAGSKRPDLFDIEKLSEEEIEKHEKKEAAETLDLRNVQGLNRVLGMLEGDWEDRERAEKLIDEALNELEFSDKEDVVDFVKDKKRGLGLSEERLFEGFAVIYLLSSSVDRKASHLVMDMIAENDDKKHLEEFITFLQYYLYEGKLDDMLRILNEKSQSGENNVLSELRRRIHDKEDTIREMDSRINGGWTGLQGFIDHAINTPLISRDIVDKIMVTMIYLRHGIGRDTGFQGFRQIEEELPRVRQGLIDLLARENVDFLTKRNLLKVLAIGTRDMIETLRMRAIQLVHSVKGFDSRTDLVGNIRNDIHNYPSPQHLAIMRAYKEWVSSGGKKGAHELRAAGYSPEVTDIISPRDKPAVLRACDRLISSLEEVYGNGNLENLVNIYDDWRGVISHKNFDDSQFIGKIVNEKQQDRMETAHLARVIEARERLGRIIEEATSGAVIYHSLRLHNRLEFLFYSCFCSIDKEGMDISEKKALLSFLVRNTMVNGYDDPSLAIIEQEIEDLDLSEDENNLTKFYFIMKRLERFLSRETQNAIERYQPMAETTADAIRAREEDRIWIENFSSNLFRADTIYLLSLWLHEVKNDVMEKADISGWQSLVSGEMIGKLHYVESLDQIDEVSSDEIMVIKEIPTECPPITDVAGIITVKEESLLSHPAIRARQYGIPFVICPDIRAMEELLKKYKDKKVSLLIDGNKAISREVNGDEKTDDSQNRSKEIKPVLLPKAKLTGKVCYFPEEYALDTVGNKALRLSNIKRGDFLTRHISLGFGSYDLILGLDENHEIKERINNLKRTLKKDLSEEETRSILLCIQEEIKALNIPDNIISEISDNIRSNVSEGLVFLRSSTNAEDLSDYSGAGLYDSYGAVNPCDKKELSEVIKWTWSSVWNERAFYDRENCNIDHDEVRMAVLVQEMVPSEYSFVIHTVNPNNEEELVIELVEGLGEALVSGEYEGSPHRYVYNRKTGQLSKMTYANKDKKLIFDEGVIIMDNVDYREDVFSRDLPESEDILLSIIRSSLEVEKDLYGVSQDIEGCIISDEGKLKFCFVQSRDQQLNGKDHSEIDELEKVGDELNKAVKSESLLNSSVSSLRGTSQDLMEADRFRLCVPVSIFKNSTDILLALKSAGSFRKKMTRDTENIIFEVVVTGIKDEQDAALIDSLNREDIKKALNILGKLSVSILTESQIQEAAGRLGYDTSDPKNRVAIIKDFFTGTTSPKEYMAIVTEALATKEAADGLQEKIEKDMMDDLVSENVSIRLMVDNEKGITMYSLSEVINDWINSIDQGHFSTINKILPVPAPLTPELQNAIYALWEVLSKA